MAVLQGYDSRTAILSNADVCLVEGGFYNMSITWQAELSKRYFTAHAVNRETGVSSILASFLGNAVDVTSVIRGNFAPLVPGVYDIELTTTGSGGLEPVFPLSGQSYSVEILPMGSI